MPNLFEEINRLDLNTDDYVIVGGAVLVALGLLEWDGDIDVCVKPEIYDAFKASGWREEIWQNKMVLKSDAYDVGVGFGEWSIQDLKEDALLINNVSFISLVKLREWKVQQSRPKDLEHIKLINNYLLETNG
jgi:hypothetical protein